MTDQLSGRLSAWKNSLPAVEPQPTDEDIRIVCEGYPKRPTSDALSRAGQQRLEEMMWLCKQRDSASTQPWKFMPKAIRWSSQHRGVSLAKQSAINVPESEASEMATPSSDNWQNQAFEALSVWRENKRKLKTDTVDNFKDSDIRDIVASGFVEERDIATLLPPSLQVHAPAIAAVVAQYQPTETPQSPPVPIRGEEQAEEIATPDPDTDLVGITFVPYDYAADLSAEVFTKEFGYKEGVLTAHVDKNDHVVTLGWQPSDMTQEGERIYRIIDSDRSMPLSPEYRGAMERMRTRSTSFKDKRGFDAAVRYYQIWENAGATLDDACLAQPTLLGSFAVVAPLDYLRVQQEGDDILLSWSPLKHGAARVIIERKTKGRFGGNAETEKVTRDPSQGSGFKDSTARPGITYTYSVKVEAECNMGVLDNPERVYSVPLKREITTQVRLQAVSDLRATITTGDGTPRIELTWTRPPDGAVVIYRTVEQPQGDVITIHELARLESAQLKEKDIVSADPEDLGDGTCSMRGIRIPEGKVRAYFTAVTVKNQNVAVAPAVPVGVAPSVENVRLIDYGDTQILTFEWPIGGITEARIYVVREGSELEDGAQPLRTVDYTEYIYSGGARLDLRRLQSIGDLQPLAVHVVTNVRVSNEEEINSPPVSVTYQPHCSLRYNIDQKDNKLTLTVESDRPIGRDTIFNLVYRKDRLPLYHGDGDILGGSSLGKLEPTKQLRVEAATVKFGWDFSLPPGLVGWIRLCIVPSQGGGNLPKFALYDPPIGELRLRPV